MDKTALNHKVKAYRDRAPRNKADAICILEVEDRITKAFACVIQDKKADAMIPIIVNNVKKGTTIWTDEHNLYGRLNSLGYSYDTVCHKKEIINRGTDANTQAVESLNSEIKLEIKRQKGIQTEKRQDFLNEFV